MFTASEARRFMQDLNYRRVVRSTPDHGRLPMKLIHRILDRHLHNDRYTIAACNLVCKTWHDQIGSVREWMEGHSRPFQQEFPLDITIHILEHLSDDKLSLKRCSLVSRAWEPCARYQLFHTVRVDCNTFARMRNEVDGQRNTGSIHDALLAVLDASPSIRQSIQRLYMHGSVAARDWDFYRNVYTTATISVDALKRMLSHLQHLSVLHLSGVNIQSHGPYGSDAIPPDLADLSTRLSPHLREIALHDVLYNGVEEPRVEDGVGLIHPSATKNSAWSLHAALASSPKAHALTQVSTTWLRSSWNDHRQLDAFLNDIGTNLRDLRVMLPTFIHQPVGQEDMAPSDSVIRANLPSISPCTQLTSFSIGIQSAPLAWRYAAAFLCALPASVSELASRAASPRKPDTRGGCRGLTIEQPSAIYVPYLSPGEYLPGT
ncbi:hypothetical protein NM688_g7215 [Phlebia brevispora]|uniref:Uncharacterized protein n=1 Tax=Phlebia brevispora TaxID=194682 RepID=A0ACC1S7U5_9APHY|nr:hypothetical protein NM688_g7215 [Phlebia brevispora]